MKLNQLEQHQRVRLVENHLANSRLMLAESCIGLTKEQSRVVDIFYTSFEPLVAEFKLMEATLTPDQIQQMFGDIEQTATASGKNRTMLGKGVDAAKLPVKVAKAIDSKLNELGRMAQEAGPIKKMDEKFEELKKKISTDNPEVAKRVKAVSDWAKANPNKASLAVGVLTAAAAFAGGPAGGAAAGFFLRSANDLLKGEKLSTAVGSAAKTAAYGALAGLAFKALSDTVIDNIAAGSNAEFDAMEQAMKTANLDAEKAKIFNQLGFTPDALEGTSRLRWSGNINNFYYNYDTALTASQNQTFNALRDAVSGAELGSPEYYEAAGKLHDFAAQAQNSAENLRLKVSWDALKAAQERISDMGDGFLKGQDIQQLLSKLNSTDKIISTVRDLGDAGAAIVQGALQSAKSAQKDAIDAKAPDEAPEQEPKKEESIVSRGKKLSEGQVYYVFKQIDEFNTLMEAPKAEKQPEQPAENEKEPKKPGMLSRMGKNLTTKVTADKLNKAWKKAGSPTDSAELAKFLQTQGVDRETMAPVYKNMKLPVPKMQPADKKSTEKSKTKQSATDTTAADKSAQTKTKTAPSSKTAPTANTTEKPAQAKPSSAYAQTKQLAQKMSRKQKQQMVTLLRKDLGIA